MHSDPTWPVAQNTAELLMVLVALRSALAKAPENLAWQSATAAELETLSARCEQAAASLRHHLDAPDNAPDLALAANAREFQRAGLTDLPALGR